MNTRVRVEGSAAMLRERLEALVAQLAELERLRERVGREENLQRKLRKAGAANNPARTFQLRTGKAHAHTAYSQDVGLL
ncbi:hypothetical protein HZZ13_10865 [Bradyrhizobium sp. CNPSo 4010]|uniref:Transposase n=1 Tax=Bradyrhizobium agreste TaxID=2751811 RepID=A0ABS0PM52_9BRAD|nr:hypothetical protein [Bradyrhizobium agreste]MBH5398289.1 hypothetical protein [Bradyrhizobium agreste]